METTNEVRRLGHSVRIFFASTSNVPPDQQAK